MRAVVDALDSLSRHPEVRAREDYQDFTAEADHGTQRVVVTTADPARFHALLRAVAAEGGFGPGAVFERLLEAELAAQKANTRMASRSPAEVRRRLSHTVNPYLHLGSKPAEVLNAFDKVLEVRPEGAGG